MMTNLLSEKLLMGGEEKFEPIFYFHFYIMVDMLSKIRKFLSVGDLLCVMRL